MSIIADVNNKGGVGKTTSVAIKAELIALTGKRVLVIDMDQQSNLSMYFNAFYEDERDVIDGLASPKEKNIADLFKYRYKTKEEIKPLIRSTSVKNLDILPSSKRHKYTPLNIMMESNKGNNNTILKNALEAIKDDYDYILIDSAPASDVLTINIMFAANYILVPLKAEGFSFKGLKEILNELLYIKDKYNLIETKIIGAFLTQVELNTTIYKDIKKNYEVILKDKFLRTPIRKDIKIQEVQTKFEPILKYSPNTNSVFDYIHLLIESNILDVSTVSILKSAIGE